MRFLFDPDSRLMQAVSRLCDLAVLNVVFLLSCLPLITIGAAVTALYQTVFPMDTPQEGPLLSGYFRAFRENFRQSTVIWLFFALFGAATWLNMEKFSALGGTLGYVLFLVAMAAAMLLGLTWGYAFPLLSRFRSSTAATLKNALLLSIAHLPRSLAVLAVNVFPWGLLLVNLYAFTKLSFLWLALYFSAAAYLNSRLLTPVFTALHPPQT